MILNHIMHNGIYLPGVVMTQFVLGAADEPLRFRCVGYPILGRAPGVPAMARNLVTTPIGNMSVDRVMEIDSSSLYRHIDSCKR